MSTTKLDGIALRNFLLAGYANLENEKDRINSLNVFPVPDGDTGINMAKTLGGGTSATENTDAAEYMKAFSKKALLTARGNSGVILSQFIRGFAKGCAGKNELSVCDFADAFQSGVDCAYSAVIMPVEGTMLTVLRETGEYLLKNAHSFEDFEECFRYIISRAEKSLNKTPELLPVLKEAGVVDSGGEGVLCILRGMEAALLGQKVVAEKSIEKEESVLEADAVFGPDFEFEYGYCTEFILQLLSSRCDVQSFDIAPLSAFLESVGDSVVAVCDGDIVKVHVHTKTPEAVIAEGRRYGELLTVKIENMSVQHSQSARKGPRTKYAIVAVAQGEGLKDYFTEIGVNAFVKGGQTNNPSTNDFIATFKTLNAEHIIVLPNNSNIILTAKQAAKLYSDADVRVIDTKSVAEGYSALSMMDLTCNTAEGLVDSMTAYLPDVTTGYITVATRSLTMNGVDVREGSFIGLDNDSILSCNENKIECAAELFRKLPNIEDKAVATVFYGKDVTKEEIKLLENILAEELPDLETGFIFGGQDVYSFIFSIE